jgi:hypothetical protein
LFRGLHIKLRKRTDEELEAGREPPGDDRSSGEVALETIEDEAAEAAPGAMPRLNTDEL